MTDTSYSLLRDTFATADGVLVSGPATPGAGTHTVTGTAWYAALGKLFGGGEVGAAWGDNTIVYDGFARLNGRTLWSIVRIEDRQAPLFFGWTTASNIVDPRADGHGYVIQDGSLDIAASGVTVQIDASIYDMRPMHYLIAVVLLDTGAAVLISAPRPDSTTSPGRTTPWSVPEYPSAAMAHITRRGSNAMLYPSISAEDGVNSGEAINGHTFDDVRVIDVAAWAGLDPLSTFADRFTRADSATTPGNSWANDRGTWGISGDRLYIAVQPGGQMANCRRDIGVSDGIYRWTVNVGTSVGQFAVTFRHTSAGNFLRLTNNSTTNTWHLQQFVGGAYNDAMVSGATTWTINTSYDLTVYATGNKYFILKDDVPLTAAWYTDANNYNITGTGIGVGTFDAVGAGAPTFDSISLTPFTITLPTELQAPQNLATLQQIALGVLGVDAFNAANGTSLLTHFPDTGPLWQLPLGGAAAIQSNKLVFANGHNQQLAIQSIGTAYHECEVTITLVNPITNWTFAGICVAYVDANNWFVARLAGDVVSQPGVDEVETMRCIGGAVVVTGKTQYGNYWQNQGHNPVTLKTQVLPDGKGSNIVLIYLDGHYFESYVLPVELYASTGAGIYRDTSVDQGSIFDGWSVRTMDTTIFTDRLLSDVYYDDVSPLGSTVGGTLLPPELIYG